MTLIVPLSPGGALLGMGQTFVEAGDPQFYKLQSDPAGNQQGQRPAVSTPASLQAAVQIERISAQVQISGQIQVATEEHCATQGHWQRPSDNATI